MPFGSFRLNTLSQAVTGGYTPPVTGGNLDAISLTSSDYLYMSNPVTTGEGTSSQATFSFWVKMSSTSPRNVPWGMRNGASRLFAPFFYNNTVDATARFYHQTEFGTIDRTSSETNLYNTGEWVHMVASYDISSGNAPQVYVNGVQATMPVISSLSEVFPWETIDLWINGYSDGGNTQNIEVAQVWIDTVYYDLSTNLDKFYDTANQQAVDMGTDGTLSGLQQPLVYHNGAQGTFESNNGFTPYTLSVNGSITTTVGPSYGGATPPPPPPPGSGGETDTVLDLRESSMSYHNGAQYVGTNTQGEPVFLTINEDPSGGSGNIKYQMFSVSTDSTVTKGTLGTVFPSSELTVFRWTSERSAEGAGYKQEMMEQNYGVGTFSYTSSATQWYAVAFEIDVDAKTITVGTPTAWGGGDTTSSAWDIAYMGNQKYYAFDRGGNNDSYMITQTITRINNLVSLSNEDYSVGASGGMGFGEVIGFPNQSVAYCATLNNSDGVGIGVQRLDGSVYLDGNGNNVAFNAGEAGDGNESNSGAPTMHKVDNNRFMVVGFNTVGGYVGTFTRVIDTNWNGGSTPPTTTAGPVELLTSNTTFGAPVVCPRPNTPDTVRIISPSDFAGTASGKWQYHDLNVTGTTITQGTWQELATTVNRQDYYNATAYSDGVNTYTVITYEELGTSNIGVITLVD